MARVARSSLPDGIFHVYARGIAGSLPLFADDDDRRFFLALLARCVDAFRWRCHAFALLSTHYHLVVETTRANLSAGLHRLNWRYADHVNDRYERFGHVFASRFQARVIETEEYLYDACTYVLQNPVRAGLCDRPEDWPWTYSRYVA
jgi:putative transposase